MFVHSYLKGLIEMDIVECKTEELQDTIDVLEAILGNEEGVLYVANQAFKELPRVKAEEEGRCARKDTFYMITNVMEVWKHMMNIRIPQNFVEYVLGPEVGYPGEPYKAEEFSGFILKVFTSLKTMLQERLATVKH